MLGSAWWIGGDSGLGSVALKERGLVKEVESKREILLKSMKKWHKRVF